MRPPSLLSIHARLPPAITIHSLDHARLALAPDRPVTLLSARAAAVFAGPAWWRALIATAGTNHPDVIDCADAPGRALEALALGCRTIILLPCPARAEVVRRATAAGACVLPDRPPSLDLADPASIGRIDAWLQLS